MHNNELYAFAPKAKYDKIDAYPELKMEGYKLVENNWENLGIVLDDYFWPMCEPIRLDNNSLLMAGLKSDSGEAAVALCDGKDLTKWEMKIIPNPDKIDCWGETTVLKLEGKLLAITRSGVDDSCALVSESSDNGLNWSGLKKTNFKISIGKMYAGTLSCENDYLVFSAKDKKYRDSLCIATGKNGFFDRVYTIRHGFDEIPRFWKNNEWCYPYAYEDKESNRLYVVYAKNKEDCELAIIPIDALTE